MVASTDLPAALGALLAECTGKVLPVGDYARSFQDLGITSRSVIQFLVAIEDQFHHEWDLDTPSEAIASVVSIADYLERRTSTAGSPIGNTVTKQARR